MSAAAGELEVVPGASALAATAAGPDAIGDGMRNGLRHRPWKTFPFGIRTGLRVPKNEPGAPGAGEGPPTDADRCRRSIPPTARNTAMSSREPSARDVAPTPPAGMRSLLDISE
jgi:hypothetical protein